MIKDRMTFQLVLLRIHTAMSWYVLCYAALPGVEVNNTPAYLLGILDTTTREYSVIIGSIIAAADMTYHYIWGGCSILLVLLLVLVLVLLPVITDTAFQEQRWQASRTRCIRHATRSLTSHHDATTCSRLAAGSSSDRTQGLTSILNSRAEQGFRQVKQMSQNQLDSQCATTTDIIPTLPLKVAAIKPTFQAMAGLPIISMWLRLIAPITLRTARPTSSSSRSESDALIKLTMRQ